MCFVESTLSSSVFLRREPDDRFDDLAALEEQQRRNAANLELECRVGIVVHVQLADVTLPA